MRAPHPSKGTPKGSRDVWWRHFRSKGPTRADIHFRSRPLPVTDVTSGHVTSGRSTSLHLRKYAFVRTHILLRYVRFDITERYLYEDCHHWTLDMWRLTLLDTIYVRVGISERYLYEDCHCWTLRYMRVDIAKRQICEGWYCTNIRKALAWLYLFTKGEFVPMQLV